MKIRNARKKKTEQEIEFAPYLMHNDKADH